MSAGGMGAGGMSAGGVGVGANELLRGVVVEFDTDVGLGLVESDAGGRYPFHCIEVADGTRTIEVGAAVEFTTLAKFGRYEAAAIRPAP